MGNCFLSVDFARSRRDRYLGITAAIPQVPHGYGRLVALGSAKTVVEVESVDVECYTLCHIRDIIKKKPSSDGHVHSRKNGGA